MKENTEKIEEEFETILSDILEEEELNDLPDNIIVASDRSGNN